MKIALTFSVIISTFITSFAQANLSSIDSLKLIISNNHDGKDAVSSLLRINQLYYQQNKLDSALIYYQSLEKSYKGEEVEAAAICLSVPILLRKNSYDEVKNRSVNVKDKFKGTRWAEESLYNLGELYINIYQDKEAADKYFRELITDYPDGSLVNSAKTYLGY